MRVLVDPSPDPQGSCQGRVTGVLPTRKMPWIRDAYDSAGFCGVQRLLWSLWHPQRQLTSRQNSNDYYFLFTKYPLCPPPDLCQIFVPGAIIVLRSDYNGYSY